MRARAHAHAAGPECGRTGHLEVERDVWGPCWGVLMSSPTLVGQIPSFGMLMCNCILMGGDAWESVLLQMCVQVCMLVSGSKCSKSWGDIQLCTEDV